MLGAAPRHRPLVIENLESRALLSVTEPGTLNRPADPVVLTGASLPAMIGTAPDDIVAFRDTGSGWQQVPIQVDERAMVTMYQIYGQTLPTANQTILTYTDPNTWVGADPDANLDADDEVVFMAKDTGGKVPSSQAAPADVDPASKIEFLVTDSVDVGQKGWIYLFRRTSGAISPGAGLSYVNYQFNLLVGDGNYKTNYDTASGPNPENSTLVTPYYSRLYTERWITNELKINVGTNVDLLDRHRTQFAPGVSARTENTFSAAEGAFIINKSGPVRAVRSWVGANSGPYTQREELFYEQREDVVTYLRVHSIPGVMDLFDYTANANGMMYYNSLNLGGTLVDGNPDTVTTGATTWEMITGAQGSLSHSHVLTTNLPGYVQTSYYLDDTTPPPSDVQVTGDSQSWGQGGPWLQNLQSTDAAAGSPYSLTSRRAMYYAAPGMTVADAQRNDSLVRNPLTGVVVPAPSTVVGRQLFYNQSGTASPLRYDGNNAAINANDDLAIATDKSAYLPGTGASTFANVSSYTKGINGIMIDLAGTHGTITAADFIFRVGNNNTPNSWVAGPAPSSISVRAGAGVSGSDRVTLTWANGAISKQWLEVILLANTNTGLEQKAGYPVGQGDVFFFGHALGDTGAGDTATQANVSATDEIGARNNPLSLFNNVPITNVYDFNRDAQVNATDAITARNNPTTIGNVTRFITVANPPTAPETAAASDGGAVASALTVPTDGGPAGDGIPRWLVNRLDSLDLESGPVSRYLQHLADEETPAARKILKAVDGLADHLALGDSLLDDLLSDLSS